MSFVFFGILLLIVIVVGGGGLWRMSRRPTITFEIHPEVMPPGSTIIYITGSRPELGDWQTDQIALTRGKDGVWTRSFRFEKDAEFEFKLTRGEWWTEAIDARGEIYNNIRFLVEGDEVVSLRIPGWRDTDRRFHGKITGAVRYHSGMAGDDLLPHDVIVWLPPDYEQNTTRRYPVLYAQDGQNLFDPVTSYTGYDWQLDEITDSLIKNNAIEDVIMVGIYNTPHRAAEYHDTETGVKYREFLIGRLKLFIDTTYRTRPERQYTAAAGSSSGGLAAFLLAWKHPDIFSKAICLSPAFLIQNIDAVSLVTESPDYKPDLKLFICNGGQGIDFHLQPGCDQMIDALLEKGYRQGQDLEWHFDPHANHMERDWGRQMGLALPFIFQKKQPSPQSHEITKGH